MARLVTSLKSEVTEMTYASSFKAPPTEPKEARAARELPSRFAWVEEHEADTVLADLLDSPKFHKELREYLTDSNSVKGDLELWVQGFIENYFEQMKANARNDYHEEDSEHG